MVDHSTSPVLLAGFLIIKPRRHCEHLAELTHEEMARFGPLLRLTCAALSAVLKPDKIFTCSLGEAVRHVHFYVVPRRGDMPANGIEVVRAMFEDRTWATSDEDAAHVSRAVRDEMTHLRGRSSYLESIQPLP